MWRGGLALSLVGCATRPVSAPPVPDPTPRADTAAPPPEPRRSLRSAVLVRYRLRQTVITAEENPFPFQTRQTLRRDSVTAEKLLTLESAPTDYGFAISLRSDSVSFPILSSVDSLGASLDRPRRDSVRYCERDDVITSPEVLARLLILHHHPVSRGRPEVTAVGTSLCLGATPVAGIVTIARPAGTSSPGSLEENGQITGSFAGDSTQALPIFLRGSVTGTYRVFGRPDTLQADSVDVRIEHALAVRNARLNQTLRHIVVQRLARLP